MSIRDRLKDYLSPDVRCPNCDAVFNAATHPNDTLPVYIEDPPVVFHKPRFPGPSVRSFADRFGLAAVSEPVATPVDPPKDPYAYELDEIQYRVRQQFAVGHSRRAHVLLTGITEGSGRVYRTPFWTRHMLGVVEAERDRRLHG